jgi:hypothetical protein
MIDIIKINPETNNGLEYKVTLNGSGHKFTKEGLLELQGKISDMLSQYDKWICPLCGYAITDEEWHQLRLDVCPRCKTDLSNFKFVPKKGRER